MHDDFFAGADTDPDRDGSGRPLIRPRPTALMAAGAAEDALLARSVERLVPYTRASNLASFISDDAHIHKWEMRYLAKAMGKHEDLAALAAIETYSTGFGADLRTKSASGRRLDAIIERALDRERIHEKADYGTAVHGLTEPDNKHLTPPERMTKDVESFWAALKEYGVILLATEVFTACDETQSAGTFDHLVFVPGYGICIGDKKTGRLNGHEFGVQLSTYAHSDVYDYDRHERMSLEDYVARVNPEAWELCGEINRDVGIIFHVKDGKTDLYELDLAMGWQGAKAAAAARDYLEFDGMLSSASKQGVQKIRREVLAQIHEAPDEQALGDLWRENKHLWDDTMTTAATYRKQAIA